MDRFEAMRIFVLVAETSSFTKAAKALDLPTPKISRTVQTLEELVGVRLLNRSTRRVSLTEEGALYYEHCTRILADVVEAETSLSDKIENPGGILRVDTSGTLARSLIIPALDDFHRKYPKLEVRLGLGDRNIDLLESGVDCVLRMGPLQESSLIARRIGDARVITCAAPAYLKEYGTPKDLEALRDHVAVNYASSSTRRTFPFEFSADDGPVRIQMPSLLTVNDGNVYISAGVAGHGIIQPSRFMVRSLIEEGKLIEILGSYESPASPLSIVYPHRRNLNARLRVFVDWIQGLVAGDPDLMLQNPRADRPRADSPAGNQVLPGPDSDEG
jgi:LysR family transcriptional regulator, regulator for bpeEF and oprC